MSSGNVISSLRRKYAMIRGAETLLFGIGCGSLLWALSFAITHRHDIAIPVALVTAAVTLFVRVKTLGLFSITDERIAFFLNRQFAELKDSSDLVLKSSSDLSDLEQIQAKRAALVLSQVKGVKLPHQLPASIAIVVVSILATIAVERYLPDGEVVETGLQANDTPLTTDEEQTGSLTEHKLLIQPPKYTGILATETQNLTTTVPQGSSLSWQFDFRGAVDRAWLQFSNGDSVGLTNADKRFAGKMKIEESLIYRLRWNGPGGLQSSDYFEITSKPDESPSVQIRNMEQFMRLKWGERGHVDVPVVLHDDFGLTQGHIIATVSKGSGESVKFREEKLSFESASRIAGRDVRTSRRIDFKTLGMEPGDEVYFYAEAFDNKTPNPQRNRTETYFISLQDTATNVATVDASLGVDLMPEYFRSQRQIIIDTEKLLKDKPKISKQTFNSTSNELGYDQKVLRLKYGQFLGEEFETTIGEPAHEEEEQKDGEEQDPAKKYGHQHDKDNEHNLVAAKKADEAHKHDEEGEGEDLMNAYKHEHDNMEEATFFTMSVRAKLKAALTLMWESELQLRLFEPKASLPIQYKILNLLREISQDSRIYVHRMGFDPPPLKEERRLTGDLEEIGNPRATAMATRAEKYPAIRAALLEVQEALATNPPVVTNELKASLEQAGNEIAAASLGRPGDYLTQLSQIRAIVDGTIQPSEVSHALKDIESACWNIIPPQESGPNQSEDTRHTLDLKLLEELKKPAND